MKRDHRECDHSWRKWFGPVLKCEKCGAETIVSAAPGESKPIFKPAAVRPGVSEVSLPVAPPGERSRLPDLLVALEGEGVTSRETGLTLRNWKG